VIAAVILLAALQGQAGPPRVEASVDRDRVEVGEEFTYTVHASAESAEPMEVLLAPLTGFEIVSRSEATQVTAGAAPSRTTTVSVVLRALRPGVWLLAPAIARQGARSGESDRLRITVAAGSASGATALSPRVRALLARARPPTPDEPVAVSLLLSAQTVRVGEQVDVVTVAWFPRDLRLQMRRPPVLQPPAMEGAWSYPQPVPPGVADSRRVNGVVYDLFVMHQIVFPLVPGVLRTDGATLRYSVPLALQFFSQEERYTRTSGPARLDVLPLPAERRPPGFEGAVGPDLTITRTESAVRAEVRRAFTIDYVVEGIGNVALWPAPALEWPEGLRAYADQVDERVVVTDGRLGGRKTFSYLVVADSAGTFALPAARYAFFDPAAGTYRVTEVPVGRVAVAPAGDATAGRVAPPPLLSAGGAEPARAVTGSLPVGVWIILLLLPPAVWVAQRVRPRRRAPAGVPVQASASLSASERSLDRALASLVPSAATRAGGGLAPALRAAGVAEPLVARTVAVRDRLLAHRYGPGSGGADSASLADEAMAVAAELGSSHRSRRARRSAPIAAIGVAVFAVAGVAASGVAAAVQNGRPDPMSLYAQGSVRAAAEGFAQQAAADRDDPAHWYNLGAAWYRLGDDARASAAWINAARLAPRDATIRRALRLVPAPDPETARRTRALPLTPAELALIAGLCWLAGWTVLLLRPASVRGGGALLATAVVVGAGAVLVSLDQSRPLAIVLQSTELRRSPHHRAPSIAPVEAGTAVRPLRHDAAWTLAEGSDARRGWLPLDALSVINP
jgi:hypothetical protein